MPAVQPLFLPKPVVDENQIVLANDFGVEPRQFAFGPDGRLHVLTYLFYNYHRYDHKDSSKAFGTYLVNVYGTDLSPKGIADLTQLYRESDHDDYLGWDLFDPSLFVTPENRVALTTKANRTFLFNPGLANRIGAFGGTDPKAVQTLYDQGFAYQAEPAADGRLLCVVSEPGVSLRWFGPNLICWSDGTALSPDHRPDLRCIACVAPDLKVDATFPYIHLADGTQVGKERRPTPSLGELSKQQFATSLYNPWICQALPLDKGRCMVSLFSQRLRGGSKGLEFNFALLDADGEMTGRLEGIDSYEESPYVEHHYRVAVDRVHGRIVYKNKTSCFLFDLNGQPLVQVKLDRADLKPLAAWKLGACAPDGGIVLYHPKQHLLLVTDPVPDPAKLAVTLVEAQTFVRKERTRLKKRYEAVDSRWLHPGPILRH